MNVFAFREELFAGGCSKMVLGAHGPIIFISHLNVDMCTQINQKLWSINVVLNGDASYNLKYVIKKNLNSCGTIRTQSFLVSVDVGGKTPT